MATQEEISIKASKGKEKYDAVVKRNMSFPKCLAPILQTVIPEYKKYSMEDVLGFIVNESIANDDAVDDCSATLHKMDTEMSSDTEKPIRYDLRFKTLNPELCDRKMEMNVYFHIDKVKSDEPIFDYLNAFFSGDIDGICKYINIKDDSELGNCEINI